MTDADQQPAPPPVSAGDIDYLELDDQALLRQCDVHTYRASGPGGQKRNKTDSAVRLRLRGVGISVTATESRSQHENRARALRRLRQAVARQVRRPVDRARYRPGGPLAECLRPPGQLQVGLRDGRYPPVVQEVLDVLAACGGRLSEAATLIGVTTGNLSAFLTRDPKLLDAANRLRRTAGLKPLR